MIESLKLMTFLCRSKCMARLTIIPAKPDELGNYPDELAGFYSKSWSAYLFYLRCFAPFKNTASKIICFAGSKPKNLKPKKINLIDEPINPKYNLYDN